MNQFCSGQKTGVAKPLAALAVGEGAVIVQISQDHPLLLRLTDLGWMPGTHIRCVCKSALGDPVAYAIRGSVMALRGEDAARILVSSRGDGQ